MWQEFRYRGQSHPPLETPHGRKAIPVRGVRQRVHSVGPPTATLPSAHRGEALSVQGVRQEVPSTQPPQLPHG